MKILNPFLLSLTFITTTAFSQKVMTFQEMEKSGIKMAELDSLYPNSTKTDKFQGVFIDKKLDKFTTAWGDFYMDLMTYFSENKFIWGKQTYCFNKIYFQSNGKIDYWFFNFKKSDNIAQEKQDMFLKLLDEFAKTHKIKIKAKTNFAQCASVDFVDM